MSDTFDPTKENHTQGGEQPCAQTQSQSSAVTMDSTRPPADATPASASNAAPQSNPAVAATPRQHLVQSAAYWFNAAREPNRSKGEAVMLMENAYNHVENALSAAHRELGEMTKEKGKLQRSVEKLLALPSQIELDQLRAKLADAERELEDCQRKFEHAMRDMNAWRADRDALAAQFDKARGALRRIHAYGARSIIRHTDRTEMWQLAEAALTGEGEEKGKGGTPDARA